MIGAGRGRRPVIIGGPTASGKSALALAVAERDGGVVINADALQVYACWRVLSARPTAEDEARVPHALYGHVAPQVRYSVGAWLRDVAGALDFAAAAGRRPVIVGGTGLYLSALCAGLVAIPPVPAAVREAAEARLADGGVAALRDDLAQRDPATARAIDLRNPARVQRAWEVLEATGRGLALWQSDEAPPLIRPDAAVRLVVNPPAASLTRRIEARFRTMVEAGALDECRRALADGWWDARLPAAKALGAPELVAHLRGEIALEDALEGAVVATRQFAKRQRTWLRGRMADWTWHEPEPREAAALLALVPRD